MSDRDIVREREICSTNTNVSLVTLNSLLRDDHCPPFPPQFYSVVPGRLLSSISSCVGPVRVPSMASRVRFKSSLQEFASAGSY